MAIAVEWVPEIQIALSTKLIQSHRNTGWVAVQEHRHAPDATLPVNRTSRRSCRLYEEGMNDDQQKLQYEVETECSRLPIDGSVGARDN